MTRNQYINQLKALGYTKLSRLKLAELKAIYDKHHTSTPTSVKSVLSQRSLNYINNADGSPKSTKYEMDNLKNKNYFDFEEIYAEVCKAANIQDERNRQIKASLDWEDFNVEEYIEWLNSRVNYLDYNRPNSNSVLCFVLLAATGCRHSELFNSWDFDYSNNLVRFDAGKGIEANDRWIPSLIPLESLAKLKQRFDNSGITGKLKMQPAQKLYVKKFPQLAKFSTHVYRDIYQTLAANSVSTGYMRQLITNYVGHRQMLSGASIIYQAAFKSNPLAIFKQVEQFLVKA